MKHKPYKDRDHSVSEKAKELRRAMASQSHGRATNVGDPNEKMSSKSASK